jgi:hypothetical protein
MRFAERSLSKNKSDPSHNPSFKSCMIRVPGSYNSTCVVKDKDAKVKVIQNWNGNRPAINLMYCDFYACLVNKRINNHQSTTRGNRMMRGRYSNFRDSSNRSNSIMTIPWIEDLLRMPIDDFRKNAISIILAPYLINIKKLSKADAFMMIRDWLNNCDAVKKLDSDFTYRIKYDLDRALKNRSKPLHLDTLKDRNPTLYRIIVNIKLT